MFGCRDISGKNTKANGAKWDRSIGILNLILRNLIGSTSPHYVVIIMDSFKISAYTKRKKKNHTAAFSKSPKSPKSGVTKCSV